MLYVGSVIICRYQKKISRGYNKPPNHRHRLRRNFLKRQFKNQMANIGAASCGNKTLKNLCNSTYHSQNSPVYKVQGLVRDLAGPVASECGREPDDAGRYVSLRVEFGDPVYWQSQLDIEGKVHDAKRWDRNVDYRSGEPIPLGKRLMSAGISVQDDTFDNVYWVYAELTYRYMPTEPFAIRTRYARDTGEQEPISETDALGLVAMPDEFLASNGTTIGKISKRWNNAGEMDSEANQQALYGCLGFIKDDVSELISLTVCFVPRQTGTFATNMAYRLTYKEDAGKKRRALGRARPSAANTEGFRDTRGPWWLPGGAST